jgi:hypothetical protein
MNAHFEPLSGIVRVFADGNTYGDSYEWCATCRFLDQKRVEILGVTKPMTPSIWRAIVERFGEMGVETIVFLRKRNGRRCAVRRV